DLTEIAGGTVYDPLNGIDGQVRELWIADGKIVAAPTDPAVCALRTIDATGLIVMPGAIGIPRPIAGPKENLSPKMRPQGKTGPRSVPSHSDDSPRHDGKCPQHVCHRLQVRRPRIHDRLRCGDSTAWRPSRARRVR